MYTSYTGSVGESTGPVKTHTNVAKHWATYAPMETELQQFRDGYEPTYSGTQFVSHQHMHTFLASSTAERSISLQTSAEATTGGPSSMIFWWRLCTEQSRPFRAIAFCATKTLRTRTPTTPGGKPKPKSKGRKKRIGPRTGVTHTDTV